MPQFASIEAPTNNIGDEIQILAALQFLPPDVIFVDRNRIGDAVVPPDTKIILNGWYLREPARWPPAKELDPLIVGFHAVPAFFNSDERLAYFREQSKRRPVGARDLPTLALFREAGADAYFSGCMTLTLRLSDPPPRGEQVLAVDVSRSCLNAIRRQTERPIVVATQRHVAGPQMLMKWLIGRSYLKTLTLEQRLDVGRERLAEIAAAKVVVTGRLHVALPCLALGTPVLFVTHKPRNRRLDTWLDHLNWCTEDDFVAGKSAYDFANPPPNPDRWIPLRDGLVERCEAFTGIRQQGIVR